MIAADATLESMIRLVAPIVWRNDAAVRRKLEEFAATEAGSALDMLKAAELAEDPKLRRLFFVHAIDEARHARMFAELARTIDAPGGISEYAKIHARRQNLFEKLGLPAFLAFVHLAERRGEAHFRALRRHFADRPELEQLFEQIAKEEKFHVRYSIRALRELERNGLPRSPELPTTVPGPSARATLARVRLASAWQAWRRAGRTLGDLASRVLLSILYWILIPPFALAQRMLEPEKTGWKVAPAASSKLGRFSARRQF